MSTPEGRIAAVRGATTASADEPDEIEAATAELVAALLDANGMEAGDIISMVFTATPDLTSAFPATGARRIPELEHVAMIGASEMSVPDALPRCIRVLVHFHASRANIRPVYLRDAVMLRTGRD